jgi:hypothetical protein
MPMGDVVDALFIVSNGRKKSLFVPAFSSLVKRRRLFLLKL